MLVKAKTTATVTVIRSRFFSTTVDPAAAEPIDPPNMSERPPPFPLCIRMRKMSAKAGQDLQYHDDCGQHGIVLLCLMTEGDATKLSGGSVPRPG